ncbi:hypothetical protein EKK97_00385 [Billgrantia tianxiuensis]|uniref:Quinohemoprotein amine dehydrogenase alpha subunit domain-containing protein n=1 Tax=Billgrantia tianxiuensis TaxID=2497861 RepID=A0A6I6SG27_9GAMM|nr:hypothetical protein EKK97_00385 [Halomonas tianxiuensis]
MGASGAFPRRPVPDHRVSGHGPRPGLVRHRLERDRSLAGRDPRPRERGLECLAAGRRAHPEGDWQLWGHWPGEGDFYADVNITTGEGEDAYTLTLAGAFTNGRPLTGEGRAIVYTGYEWRANLELNGRGFQQVLDLSGERPSGRIFDDRDEAFGMQVEMMPVAAAAPGLVASQPASLKAGERSRLVLLGQGLNEGGSSWARASAYATSSSAATTAWCWTWWRMPT